MSQSAAYSVEEVSRFLLEHDRILILSHAYPDGDTIGSAYALCLALRRLGKKARVECADVIPEKYGYITEKAPPSEFGFETIVAVDVADQKLLGGFEPLYGDRIDLCIDHHISNTKYAARLLLNPEASATCECIYAVILKMGLTVDHDLALALYTGISTDTGCFKYSNTTAETHRIASELMKTGIDAAEINRVMFETKSRARVEIERLALDSMEFHFDDRCAMITITKAMRAQSGCKDDDLEGITSLSRTVEGVIVGVTVREKANGRYKISMRTHAPIDASVICGKLGGGGHARAAGCELDGPLTAAKAQLLREIGQALGI